MKQRLRKAPLIPPTIKTKAGVQTFLLIGDKALQITPMTTKMTLIKNHTKLNLFFSFLNSAKTRP